MHANQAVIVQRQITNFFKENGIEPGLVGIRDVLTEKGAAIEVRLGETTLKYSLNPGWMGGEIVISEEQAGTIFQEGYRSLRPLLERRSQLVKDALDSHEVGVIESPWSKKEK